MTTVFLHGLGQTSTSWKKTISLLPEDGDCRCPELSQLLGGKQASFQNLYAGLEAYCSKIPGTFCLCGLSLGGVLALQYAADHPEKLHSLVLIGAQYRSPKLLLALQNLVFRFMKDESFQSLGYSKEDFIRLCKTTGQVDLTARLSGICCPTLVLCGEDDKPNKKAALGLSKSIPGSELHFISDSGHQVNLDNPRGLADLLQDFLGMGSSHSPSCTDQPISTNK